MFPITRRWVDLLRAGPGNALLQRSARARTARRARAALLWATVLFFVIQLAGGGLIDHYWEVIRFPEAHKILMRMERRGNGPSMVFLGSSRFMNAVRPFEIDRLLADASGQRPPRALNASVPAGDPITADFMLNLLLDHGGRPEMVVVEVSPETLNHRNEWIRYHAARQLTWRDVPRYAVDLIATGNTGTLLKSRFLPLSFFRAHVLTWIEELFEAPVLARRAPRPGPSSIPLEELLRLSPRPLTADQLAMTMEGLHVPLLLLRDYRIGGNTTAALERILDRCGRLGIKVFLLGVPVTTFHRGCYTPAIDAAYAAYLRQVTQRYGCRFIDYRDRLPDYLFFDVHHLSQEGGLYFSRLIFRDILWPEWEKTHLPATQHHLARAGW